MPISGTGAVLGVALAAASGSVDQAGIAKWIGVGTAICSWLPGNATVNPGLMVGAGGSVSGFGNLTFSNVPDFGVQLANGAGSTDKKGIERWTAVGIAITDHLVSVGQVVPGSFAYPDPAGGPVTGTGTLAFADPTLGPALAVAAGSVDGPGILAWTAVGLILAAYLTSNTLVLPTPQGMASPPGGGPITGSGSIT